MSSTNCFLPNKGFCLNFRVRTVNSNMAEGRGAGRGGGNLEELGNVWPLEP